MEKRKKANGSIDFDRFRNDSIRSICQPEKGEEEVEIKQKRLYKSSILFGYFEVFKLTQ